jgi:ATP-dependent DNA ligase
MAKTRSDNKMSKSKKTKEIEESKEEEYVEHEEKRTKNSKKQSTASKKRQAKQDKNENSKPPAKSIKRSRKSIENEEEAEDVDIEYDSKTDKIYTVNGTIYPMLAQDYNKKSKHIKFPCYVQPKLDGVRAIFHKNRLWSRNGLEFLHLDHIKKELIDRGVTILLDGELYTDKMPFEELVGLVKRQKINEEDKKKSQNIKFMVFDYVSDKDSNSLRKERLEKLFTTPFVNIENVLTEECTKESEVITFSEKFRKLGYEGVILRNKCGKYGQNQRSNDLQKFKIFVDDEFEITDYTAGTGKEVGCVIWICKTKHGKIFNVRPEGNYEDRKKMYRNAKKCIGKSLTVRYQELTKEGIPRFPVGVTIRDYE